MNDAIETLENLTLNITKEVRVRAPLAVTFDALLAQMGPQTKFPKVSPCP